METSGLSQAEPAFDSLAHLDREHLAAVADAAVSDQQTTSASSPTSPSQKRKRGLPSSSPESRRAKRGAPATASSSVVSNAPDAASAAYVESAVEAAQAAAQAATANSELNVLRQATNSAGHPDASDPANASSTAAAALGTMFPTLHIPPSTTDTFAAEVAAESEHQDSVNNDRPGSESLESTNGATLHSPDDGHKSGSSRPPVGSTEWQKLRKYNHKEVERRRRETINEGINELALIVPGCEKNKGSILSRTVAFITQLKKNEEDNIAKWSMEKLLTEQALAELSASNDRLKKECERAFGELATWKSAAQAAGVQPTRSKEDTTPTS